MKQLTLAAAQFRYLRLLKGGQLRTATRPDNLLIRDTEKGATIWPSSDPQVANVKRGTSRTSRIAVLSAGIRSPLGKSQRADRKQPAEASFRPPPVRATSSRNGERNHLGTPSDIKSDWRATSSRIRGRLRPEAAPPPSPRSTRRSWRPSSPGCANPGRRSLVEGYAQTLVTRHSGTRAQPASPEAMKRGLPTHWQSSVQSVIVRYNAKTPRIIADVIRDTRGGDHPSRDRPRASR